MRRRDVSPRGALLVLFRNPGKDVLFPVEVVADQPGSVVGIRVDVVIVTIEFSRFSVQRGPAGFGSLLRDRTPSGTRDR